MPYRTYYFLEYDGQPNTEVTMEEFIAAERRAGFNGPAGRPATGGFGAPGVRGRIMNDFEEEES